MQKPQPTTLESQVSAQIARYGLLDGVRRLGVAVSGGSDSVALLRLLIPLCRTAGVTPVVLHFDHGLRGAASAADARFVARLARSLGVECRMGRAGAVAGVADADENDGRGRRTRHASSSTLHPAPSTQSVEMAARQARQTFFQETARQARLDAIATGHTADDVAETLLLRLARGSGAAGLSGLRPCHTVTGVKYVRPLLECSHAALRAGLRRKRQGWREDASNLDERIPRNRLRHTVLPWLERNWSPSVRAMLVQSASILREEDALLDELAREAMRGLSGNVASGRARGKPQRSSATLQFPPDGLPLALQRRIIRQWLLDAGCAAAAGWSEVEGMLACIQKRAAWQVMLPGGVLARGKGRQLQLVKTPQDGGRGRKSGATMPSAEIEQAKAAGKDTALPRPGSVDVAGVRVTARRAKGIVRTPGPVGVLPSACSLDAGLLQGKALMVRTRRPGDRIWPLGLDGSKTLQDLFVDAKVPAALRDRLPLLVVDDEVVWVPGYRVARAYAVRSPRAACVRVEMDVNDPAR